MQNVLRAQCKGVVKAVAAAEGDTLAVDQVSSRGGPLPAVFCGPGGVTTLPREPLSRRRLTQHRPHPRAIR